MQNVYSENYKIMLKEIKDLNNWKNIACLWIGRLNIVKKAIVATPTNRFSSFPIEISADIFVEIDVLVLKFTLNRTRPRIAETILKKKNKVEGHTSQFQNLQQSNGNRDSVVVARG